MKIKYSARSHMGKVRENNEDNLFVNGMILPKYIGDGLFSIDGCTKDRAVFAVCDGMGGESDGDAASRLAVETLLAYKGQFQHVKLCELDQAVQAYVTQASQTIMLKTAIGKRSGTTLALAIATWRGIRCFNVGDSRIYYEKDGEFQQVTCDHTVVEDFVRRNNNWNLQTHISDSHKLTRCMGIGKPPVVEGYPILPGNGRLLICSDGLTKMMCAEEIWAVLKSAACPAETADILLRTVLQRGARDNVTVIVLDLQTFDLPHSIWTKFRKRRREKTNLL